MPRINQIKLSSLCWMDGWKFLLRFSRNFSFSIFRFSGGEEIFTLRVTIIYGPTTNKYPIICLNTTLRATKAKFRFVSAATTAENSFAASNATREMATFSTVIII